MKLYKSLPFVDRLEIDTVSERHDPKNAYFQFLTNNFLIENRFWNLIDTCKEKN